MGRYRILVRRQRLEPEIRVVASVADESVVRCADHLGVAEWFEGFAVEGAESGELGCGAEEEDVVDSHFSVAGVRRSCEAGRLEVKIRELVFEVYLYTPLLPHGSPHI